MDIKLLLQTIGSMLYHRMRWNWIDVCNRWNEGNEALCR